ncbi:MAG: N-acetylmuramic acid 6-phosphate etherase [Bacteroidetes bacterium]|nr:N-acetylmuramic acid 6-phosphate etherase [Bacteroidota bacterium]
MKKTSVTSTEQTSYYHNLEKMSVKELLKSVNQEDKTVPIAVKKCIPSIEKLVKSILEHIQQGGRLFYIGAGTSGRLGIVDASECPPTFGVTQGTVIGLMAGGDRAIRQAVEFAEDSLTQGFKDLQDHKISSKDIVIGIAASGATPYVAAALKQCREKKITTACIVCNKKSAVAAQSDYKVECVVGAEFVTGSTRMKAGTAQKLILNMISTSVMIKLGHVQGNKMVDMQLSNHKLIARGTKMIMQELNIRQKEASQLLKKFGKVRVAIEGYRKDNK